MKNIFLTISILISVFASAQVAIGKPELSKLADGTTPNPNISLEFYDGADNARGIILPWVTNTSAVTDAVNGTLVYNTSDKKVYVKYASGWKDLSVDATGTTIDPIDNVDGLTLQNSLNDLDTAKVSIGTPTSTPGILVLEDTNKAMVLPKVASPHLTIINPAPGMMVYDTTKKQLAVFNGTVWSFWKP
ncbi:hypothetical protein [Cloacibacterium caeni]|uniref:hypothetical protein n=1 Tax=Cloacibacterium caeni TaxID=2004710 RepID=UPI001BCF1F2A|nr:hypothetical protein [Cloacibacterium caeni]